MDNPENRKIQFNVQSNVTIKCLDKNKKVIRSSSIHNKATINLVEGILRFLRGDFTPSEYTTAPNAFNSDDAYGYIPTEIRFGHVGVIMADRDSDKPRLVRIDEEMIKKPTFTEYKLQEEIAANRSRFSMTKIKFESATITNYDDTNNSMALSLSAYIPPGQLVGLNNGYDSHGIPKRDHFTDEFVKDESDPRDGQGWSYWNPDTEEWEAIFTEIGLYSGSGALLARVAFDGETYVDYTGEIPPSDSEGRITFANEESDRNPIIQSDTSSILIEWVLGIVSIGQNDKIITAAELTNFGIGVGLTAEEISDRISGYTSQEDGSEIIGLVNQIGMIVDHYIYGLGNYEGFTLDDVGVDSLVNARNSINSLLLKLGIEVRYDPEYVPITDSEINQVVSTIS